MRFTATVRLLLTLSAAAAGTSQLFAQGACDRQIFGGNRLSEGFDLGVNTSGGKTIGFRQTGTP